MTDEAIELQRREELRLRLLGDEPAPPPVPRKTIWFGARGEDVVALQQGLERVGIYSIEEGDDVGLFGRATESAVRAIQQMYGLPVNAVVDSETWKAVDE